MDRFHIVVSNYNHLDLFVNNLYRIQDFQKDKDKVYILDCSPQSQLKNQLIYLKKLKPHGLLINHNLFFIQRRNWNLNHGAQLDYLRLILDKKISKPKLVFFLQEHFLEQKERVKSDTFPEGTLCNLKNIESKFDKNKLIGCVFFSRNGIRVCASNPELSSTQFFWGDSETLDYLYKRKASHHKWYKHLTNNQLVPGSQVRTFCVDGGNFITRPEYFINYFKKYQDFLTKGDGSYGFCHVWETRLGKILYDQKVIWVDMVNEIQYSNYAELKTIEEQKKQSFSKFWYDNRIWYFYYGRDQVKYLPLPFLPIVKFGLLQYIGNQFRYPRDTMLKFYGKKTSC